MTFEALERDLPRIAFLGVRACEIAALHIQDRVLTRGRSSIATTSRAGATT